MGFQCHQKQLCTYKNNWLGEEICLICFLVFVFQLENTEMINEWKRSLIIFTVPYYQRKEQLRIDIYAI